MNRNKGEPRRTKDESLFYLRTLDTPSLIACARENINSSMVIGVALDRLMNQHNIGHIKDAALKRLTAENDALRLRLLEAGLSYE